MVSSDWWSLDCPSFSRSSPAPPRAVNVVADVANDNEDRYETVTDGIHMFLHCKQCVRDWQEGRAPGESMKDYARLNAGWTDFGLKLVCARHGLNVAHIDFEGVKHPADMTQPGNFDLAAETTR